MLPRALHRAAVSVALALALPAGAHAQAPVDLGPGDTPHVVMDGAGNAHVAFSDPSPGADIIRYCRLPPDGTACDAAQTFTYAPGAEEGATLGNWPLLTPDGRVLVFDARCCRGFDKYLYTSTDGGSTFGPRVHIATFGGIGAGTDGSALYTPPGAVGRPQESILTLNGAATVGLHFQATGTTGPPEQNAPQDVITQGLDVSGSLALQDNTLLAAWTNINEDPPRVYYRQWSGAGDVNSASSWLPITPVDATTVSHGSRLSAGPGGIFLAYTVGEGFGDRVVLRRFTGGGWGPPQDVIPVGTSRFDLTQDAAGVLHFAWQEEGELRYRRATSAGNSAFTSPSPLATSQGGEGFFGIRLAMRGAEDGWVTWSDNQGVHAIRAQSVPPPVAGVAVNLEPVRGVVRTQCRGQRRFTRLTGAEQVRVGCRIDAKRGTVELTSATRAGSGARAAGRGVATQTAQFHSGQFIVKQARTGQAITELQLSEPLTCTQRRGKLAPNRVRSRRLWGNGRGRFRTRGRRSAATVRGTRWLTRDSCTSTTTTVREGTVVVRDFAKRRNITVRAGRSYTARQARRR